MPISVRPFGFGLFWISTKPVLKIRIRMDTDSMGSSDPDPDSRARSESVSRRAKMTHKRMKIKNFHVSIFIQISSF
jgi:hypothetical protein